MDHKNTKLNNNFTDPNIARKKLSHKKLFSKHLPCAMPMLFSEAYIIIIYILENKN